MSFAAIARLPTDDKPALYRDLASQLTGLIGDETDLIANAANMAALLFHGLADLNWAGFYLWRPPTAPMLGPSPGELALGPSPGELVLGPFQGELVLGPFQGRPACIRIPLGRGVCGTAAATRTTQRVADVHDFPGHIACDAASRSELVVPLLAGDRLIGVLDLDSPRPDRFDAADQAGIEALAAIFTARVTF